MEKPVETKQANRRRAVRRKPRSYVRLECRKGSMGLGVNLAMTLLDVSETGARLVVRQELPLTQQVEVVFAAHGTNQNVKRQAVIRWQLKLDDGKYCLGIEFEKRLAYAEWLNLALPS